MEEEKQMRAGLPEIVEPKENQAFEKKEATKIDKNIRSKKNSESNKVGEPEASGSLQDLLLKNIKLSEQIFEQNKKIKRRLTMMTVGNYLRIILIVAPIIFAIIYLPPLIDQVVSQYGGLLDTAGKSPNLGNIFAPGNLDLNAILKNISVQDAAKLQEMLKTIPK